MVKKPSQMLCYMSNKAEAELGQAASAYDAAGPGGKAAALAHDVRRKELERQCLKQDTLDKDGIAIMGQVGAACYALPMGASV